MSDASFASLGPTLLARKGGAKPAMRPQVVPYPGMMSANEDQLEDLGWNDMGEGSDADEASASKPKRSAKKKSKGQRKAAAKASKPERRAAFTLRLDPDRHLKLRLAATMKGKSAQVLVTEALDQMLGEIADLDALARRMRPKAVRKG
ncbi:hypothetical protein INR77_04935 [Erythrobacter sp. SCSIO 43205]|uniref:type II toxin-antitoxin system HicB family antitoxin n=1 Tax=Erythrobacter sp. SCSIO 43205 TaxID=2779361 RepID=UPI001CA83DDA|nr:type II toxin-antitoxin system HicB family antitoxin [Erythrobacter sp. SCSIO 43205]UAB79039.1 hypothetical protein INR77_04935 [Erythrobacter sp. SCSIO 43205]